MEPNPQGLEYKSASFLSGAGAEEKGGSENKPDEGVCRTEHTCQRSEGERIAEVTSGGVNNVELALLRRGVDGPRPE